MGELVDVKKDSVIQSSFVYDPVGRRVEKATSTKIVTYTYDGMDILRESTTVLASTTASYYVHGPGIDEPLAKETGGVFTYYHADGLGSIVKETNQSGNVTHTLTYDAWGDIQSGERDGFAFTGREWDPETRLYYYRARYYDPKAGRFVSEDPIGFLAGTNFVSYVHNNPQSSTDPFGMSDFAIDFHRPPYENGMRMLKKAYSAQQRIKLTAETTRFFQDAYGVNVADYLVPGKGGVFDLARRGSGAVGFCGPGKDDGYMGSDDQWLNTDFDLFANNDRLFTSAVLHELTHYLERTHAANLPSGRVQDEAEAAVSRVYRGTNHNLGGYMAEISQFGHVVTPGGR